MRETVKLSKGTAAGMQYTREEGVSLLSEFQNDIIRDYKKRFNAVEHQYCTNITAARDEGWLLGKAYSEELRTSTSLTFYIPVYSKMPASCPMPE